MIYRILLILFLISIGGVQPVLAENTRYRVEILVLTHLDNQQQPRETLALEDFSSALDFLQPPEEDETGGADEIEVEQQPAGGPDSLVTPQALGEADPVTLSSEALDAVVHVEEMGPEMQDAWRRLRLSGPFRPLQYLAWEQGSNPPFPTLRVHDGEPVLIEDPWAEQRLLQDSGGLPSPRPGEPASGNVGGVTPIAGQEGSEEALPDPVVYYRLDGTARLIRTRFLHLSFALEWREPGFDSVQPQIGMPAPRSTDAGPLAGAPAPSGFLVHRLEQSRPVRSGRMEYFDGPVLGVLAWVSDVTESVEPTPVD